MVITLDAREKEIIDHVRATLVDMESSDAVGTKVFSEVLTVDDQESFIRIDAGLKSSHACDAGIIVGETDQVAGSDDTETGVVTIPITIVARFFKKRAPLADEQAAVEYGKRIAQLVRDSMIQDRGRGGKANLVRAGGRVINGTEIDGTIRFVSRDPNQMFYAIIIPFVCAYSIFS